jgi:type II secretory pathway pseudopilin PulG
VSAEFNWWLLIVGIIAGGALTWLVMADTTRREREVSDAETAAEASWIARSLGDPQVDDAVAESVLRAHRRYLGFPPPDALVDPDELQASDAGEDGSGPRDGLTSGPPAASSDAGR